MLTRKFRFQIAYAGCDAIAVKCKTEFSCLGKSPPDRKVVNKTKTEKKENKNDLLSITQGSIFSMVRVKQGMDEHRLYSLIRTLMINDNILLF